MLPDFPSIKNKLENSIFLTVSDKVHDGTFLSQIRKKTRFEGKSHSFIDSAGDYVEHEYEKVDSRFSIKDEEVLDKGIVFFVEKCLKAVQEISDKITKQFFKEIDIAVTKTGNKLDGKGKLITELYLDGLEKIQVEFDENGNPYLPTFFMHPKTIIDQDKRLSEYLKRNPSHLDEFNERLDEIIVEKRKEWDDRESNRKLVD
ncbi:hypothetical protein FGU46_05045 [Methanobacterium sp. CWC-01]|uniref:hypothetical protein n=1 Tax=Methanobacterium aridiramus TaxID=2584467 RepID=UPI0025762E2E|nr:hypothetical protein [Methanobacterium sp. CWC-01]WJI09502.1 hypothetical protein FGU46_05045 [Methanobacterium sp. CWC-01]